MKSTGNQSSGSSNNHFIDRVRDTLIRGGRVTKWKGQAASFAPSLAGLSGLGQVISMLTGSVSAKALAVALLAAVPITMTSTATQAGNCVGAAGVYTCSGAAGADVTQTIAPASPVDITTVAGFGITTAAGDAFKITSVGSLVFNDNFNSSIIGAGDGLDINNSGNGAVSVITSGAITGLAAGNGNGIRAVNTGTSSMTIETAGTVSGGDDGISAFNLSNTTTDLIIDAQGDITGFDEGINTIQRGTGVVSVSSGGTISATNFNGINVTNQGSGASAVSATGTITAGHSAISVNNTNSTTNASVDAVDVYGYVQGIWLRNLGTGYTSVTTTGTVTGTIWDGIYARGAGTSLTITTGPGKVTGGNDGIDARNNGSGATTITTTGAVTGTSNHGIYVLQTVGTDVTINAQGDVTGDGIGIIAQNQGSGTTNITTATGTTVTANRGRGIFAASLAGTGAVITVNGDVNAGTDGVMGESHSGPLTVTTIGTIKGGMAAGSSYGSGIYAVIPIAAATGDLTVNAQGDVTSYTAGTILNQGIKAVNLGSGSTTVTTTGVITGSAAAPAGSGAQGIYASGGRMQPGISGYYFQPGGGDVTVDAQNTVTGGDAGIFARTSASGATVTVTASGAVTGNLHGIYATHTNGIVADFGGVTTGTPGATGAFIKVTTSADVTALGVDGDGIRVSATEESSDNSVFPSVVTVTPSATPFDVNVDAGTVTGGSGAGVGVHTASLGDGTIDILAGATVDGSASGVAIRDGDLDADGVDEFGGNVVVTTAGTLTGDAILGLGDDTFNLTGGAMTGDIYGDDVAASAGDGDDVFNWSGGGLTGGFYGQNGSDTALVTAATYDGTQVLVGGADVLIADGWTDTLTLQGLTVSTPGANVLNWENVVIGAGATIKFNDQMLTVGDAGDATTGLAVEAGGTLDATGGGLALTGNMMNSGIVTTQDGVVGDVIAVSGDYTDGGELNVDVELGDSSSPTDQLTVAGDTSGATTLNVTNVGGAGGLTGTGATDGIEVVHVDGTSAGTFTLGGPVEVGPFIYDLVQADGQNWYLQSALQGQVYGYSALQAVLGDEIETLWQRVGQRERLLNRDGTVSTLGSGFWMRTSYTTADAEGSTTVGGAGVRTNLDYNRTVVQIGYDQKMFDNSDGMFVAGVFGHYKDLSVKIDDATGTRLANGSADGFGGGLSATWYSPSGFYGDLVGQLTSWDAKASSSTGSGSFDALTYSVSAEAGFRFDLDENARLVPQAQLVWNGGSYDNFTDSSGIAVNWNEKDVLTGRIGVALEGGNPVSKGGNGLTGYAIANLVYDLTKAGSFSASGTSIKTQLNRTRIEGRLGANLSNDDDSFTLYTEAGFATAISGKDYTSFKGIAGARFNF